MPVENKAFGELFAEKKDKLDHFQADLASILPSFPGMPAAKFFDLAIGIDFHPTAMPPLPLCPVPHIGMVFDIMGAIMAAIATALPEPPEPPEVPEGEETPPAPTTVLSVANAIVNAMKPSVKVHGRWIANAGAGVQHLPGIFVHILPVVAPMASSEMWMGSSTVLADGGPFSTQFHPALSCNIIGFPSLFRKNKPPKPKMSLMAPTSMLLAITSGGPPVLVGGPPTIDLFQLMFKMALKGMGKLCKKAKAKIKPPDTKSPNLGKAQSASKGICKSDPVDMATGKVFSTSTDFELPGPIPLIWDRTYYSNAEVNGPLGYNQHHSYNMGIYYMDNGYFTLRLQDGREATMPILALGELFYNRQEQLFWRRDKEGYILTDADKLNYRFNAPKNAEGFNPLSSIQTQAGFIIHFKYNEKGALTQIIDSATRLLNVENDDLGRILRIYIYTNDQEVNLVRYSYDALGNMVKITDALDISKHFFYQGHLLVKYITSSGLNFYWEYEGNGDDARCIHTWGDGNVLEYWLQYDQEQGKTTARNSLGHTSMYYYDASKLIYKIIDENGGVTHQKYNDYSELELVVNAEGYTTKYTYNQWGKLLTSTNENEEVTSYEYDDKLNLISITSPGGMAITWEYDQHSRIIKRKETDGSSMRYHYGGKLLSEITDGKQRNFELKFDESYNLIKVSYSQGHYQSWEYDQLGRVISTKGVDGNQTTYAYDLTGNLLQINDPDGNIHRFKYDTSGNMVHAKDGMHEVQFTYGPLGSLTSRIQNGITVQFNYDTELQLRSITNEGGEIYKFNLDAAGNVVNEWGFDGMQRRYIRDGLGRIKKILRPAEKWTIYDYDGVGNLINEEHSDGSKNAYRYNKDSFLVEAFNENGYIQLQRDTSGKILKEQQGNYTVEKVYDDEGNCIFTGSNLGAAIDINYDAFGFLEKMQTGKTENVWSVKWERNSSGLELYRQLSGGIEVKTERDKWGRVVRRSIGAMSLEQSRTRYEWGSGNRLYRIINELSYAKTDFTYDDFDNLISTTYSPTETIYRVPDKIGNLYTTKNRTDRTYGKGGQLLKDENYLYYYDVEGNLVFKEFKNNANTRTEDKTTYAKARNIQLSASATGWAYEWAANGMLCKVIKPAGGVVTFHYDPLGRRIAKIHEEKVTRWVWDNNVPLHEWTYQGKYPPTISINTEGKLEEESEPVENLITWIFEEGTFVPCAKLIGEEQYSIITNYLGTPTHAYDDKGNKVWEREIDCYGNSRKVIGEKSFCPYMYQGQYEDLETGLYYNRFRYYSPQEGVYLSQDPIGLNGGMLLYGYVTDTNTWVDPTGLNSVLGAWGEKLATKYLSSNGHRILGSIQNISGQGFDLITKDIKTGDIHIIEVKASDTRWRSKAHMPAWTNNNIGKIGGNTNGMWGTMPRYQRDLLNIINQARRNGKLKNTLLQINVKQRSIRVKCK